MTTPADLSFETSLLRDGHALVGGLDEVGRGAWAGPVVVGVVLVDVTTGPLPEGTKDSKALTRSARRRLSPHLEAWCTAWSLGEASAREIDAVGLMAALRRAAHRALGALPAVPTALIVDGPLDFVSGPEMVAWAGAASVPEVHAVVGADSLCGTVAAASVLAKTARDGSMSGLARRFPGYGFEENKGYGTRAHAAALDALGLTAQHRRSWSFAAAQSSA
jgi:ribonuclease HII